MPVSGLSILPRLASVVDPAGVVGWTLTAPPQPATATAVSTSPAPARGRGAGRLEAS